MIGVKGTIKAEPLHLVNGKEKLTLRFDCKPCEMHVVGKIKRSVLNQHDKDMQAHPMQFYRTRPSTPQRPGRSHLNFEPILMQSAGS